MKLEGHIGLAHGAGGPAMRALIAELLSDGEGEFPLDDGAVIPL
ncbi:MAG: hydrogenase expression/formation protein HypE, partial [Deltaproteobacteria bacterium]|nr:hydrogenase expression/formation protein HypE [Deltaproteobacteria bacterium]